MVSSIIFPNVVFGSYIIISCVIITSYVLGYTIPDIIVRIFNGIALILYLVMIVVSGILWTLINHTDEEYKIVCNMVLTVLVLCCLNCFLHIFDIFWNVRRIIEDINQ